jgi:hypothetical protein
VRLVRLDRDCAGSDEGRAVVRVRARAAHIREAIPEVADDAQDLIDEGLPLSLVNYVSNKNIVSLETSWKNNVRMDGGFYPGSGFQSAGDATSGAIRARLEFGNRQGTMRFTARFENGSSELTKLKQQTTGTAVISLSYDANNSLDLTWQKVSFATAEVGETDGIVTVAVECLPMWDATNGIVSAVAKCGVDNIGQ